MLQPIAGVAGAAQTEATLSATDAVGRKVTGEPVPVTLIIEEAPVAPREVKAEVIQPFLVQVKWEPVDGAAGYEVHRSEQASFEPTDETLLARWAWAVYFDVGVQPHTTYHYAVVAVGDGGLRSGPGGARPLAITDFPLPAAPQNVQAKPAMSRVTLSWDPVPEAAVGYVVLAEREGEWAVVSGKEPVRETTFAVGGLTTGEEHRFRVAAVDRAGRKGEPSAEVAATPIEPPHEPVFAATFDDVNAETGQVGTPHGKATLRDGALDVREGGWISYPNDDMLQLSGAVTVGFWANIDRIEGIPVLLSYGHFLRNGYWLQLFGNGIRWCLDGPDRLLDTSPLPIGAWHHLAAMYDGRVAAVYVDGAEVGRREIGPVDLTPWPGELRIGQYADIEQQFQTLGQLDDVRIYQRALSPDEVRESFQRGRSAP